MARGHGWLDRIGVWIRLLLVHEFGIADLEKWCGENWFADIRVNFAFPFRELPVDISWLLAIWTELVGTVVLAV